MTVRTYSGKRQFASTPQFHSALGYFFAAWSRTELAIDCATWKALGGTETAEQVHKRSAGMKFNEKCEQLRALIDDSKIPHGDEVTKLLKQIEKASGRNIFAHSIFASDEHTVTFIHRRIGGRNNKKYKPKVYRATRNEFLTHVQKFRQLACDFEEAAGLSDQEVGDFAVMAVPKKFPFHRISSGCA